MRPQFDSGNGESILESQALRNRKNKEKLQHDNIELQQHSSLYIRENLISLQAEFMDSVISYDPMNLSAKLPVRSVGRWDPVTANENESSLLKLGNQVKEHLVAILRSSSPVRLAYCQYKSAGYPWSFGCLPPSLMTILAVRYLEVSPPTAVDSTSSPINMDSDDTPVDLTFPDASPSEPVSSTEKLRVANWRRWPLTYVDPYPQWRVLALHSDEVAAIGYSNGVIEIINMSGDDNPRIVIKKSMEADFDPIVGLNFLQDSFHLLVCRFSGEMEIWNLKSKSSGYSALLVCQKLHVLPIFSAVYDPKSFLLALGGEFVGFGGGSLTVISVKDLSFSEFSHSKCSPSSSVTSTTLWSFMRSISARQVSDGFVNLCLSPEGNLLSALHCSRAISVWTFPACSLLTTIISDAVALESSSLSCKPLSPFLNSKVIVPLHLNWWRRPSEDPLLAILKSDGSLSVIDLETLENKLFSADQNQKGGPIQLAPFTSFASVNITESNRTELLLLECMLENLCEEVKNFPQGVTTRRGYLSRIATFLGISRRVEADGDFIKPIGDTVSSLMKANIVRIASTSRLELCIHRLRSGRFSEALDLAYNDDVEIDPESVWEYQFLALFHYPIKPATFERLISLCVKKIVKRGNWLLRECLCGIPCVDESWEIVDLFRTTRFLLNAGLSRSTSENITTLFRERIYHLDIITAIYVEECALSLTKETGANDPTRDVKNWWLEIEAYRQNHPLGVALWYLHTKRYAAFGILLSHYPNILTPHLISLLSTIPATEAPASYLRPIKFFSAMNEYPPLSESTESRYEVALQQLNSLLPADFPWANSSLTYSDLANWACTRAYELDHLTGLVSGAEEMLQVVTEIIKSSSDVGNAKISWSKRKPLRQLQRHLNEVNQFATILYRASPGYGFSKTLRRKIDLGGQLVCLNQLKLVEFHKFSLEQRLELFIRVSIASPSKVKAVDVFNILAHHLLPFIATYEKRAMEPRLKQCFLRISGFSSVGFEAIVMLAKQWQSGDVAVSTSLEGIPLRQCLVDFLLEYTPSPSDDSEVYLHHAQELLSSLQANKSGGTEVESRLQRLSECCDALLDFYGLIRELGYIAPPQGMPVSLGEALSLGTKNADPSRLMQLVNRWIHSTLLAQEEAQSRKFQSLKSSSRNVGIASSSLQAMKKGLHFYNNPSIGTAEDTGMSPESVEDNKVLIGIFSRLCKALAQLLGANENEKARYHLLVGVLCSGDRRLIEFARSELVQDIEHDPTWTEALQYAIGVYFDATPAFGIGEVNEELGALCLSFVRSSEDSPDSTFYGAVKFLSGLERLSGRSSSILSRSTWLKMKPERKAGLFTSALQELLYLRYMNEVNFVQAGKYFNLTEVEVNRCFLKAAIQAASRKSLPVAAVEKTVALMQTILSTPEPSAWRELRLWSRAPIEILGSLFPGVEEAVIERFRLTLARFVITHSVFEATCSEYADISSEFIRVCASQKPLSVESQCSSSSVTRRIFSVLSSSSREEPAMNAAKPYRLCSFYTSPLDPLELENCSTSPATIFFTNLELSSLDADTILNMWMNECINAEDFDIGLSYAYGPPLGLKPRNWTKLLCKRISDCIQVGRADSIEMENYRLVAASVSASTPPSADSKALFPPTEALLESLSRLAAKHPRINQWRSKALVSQLVCDRDKFFSDATYRRNELLAMSQTSHEVSLLLAKHMHESRSELVLANLSEIIFSTSVTDADEVKRQLKELSPYLKRDVPAEELERYLQETVDPRVEEVTLWKLLLLLKVILVVAGSQDSGLTLRGDSIQSHVNVLRTVMQLDTPVYFGLLSALQSEQNPAEFLSAVQPFMTSKLAVECLVNLMQQPQHASKVVSSAQIYAAYASRLLDNCENPVEDCGDCLEAMVDPNGDASVLVDWISDNLFGSKALTHPIDLEGTIYLVDCAIKAVNSRSGDSKSIKTLSHLLADLQRRFDWLQESEDISLLNNSLQSSILLHHFSDVESISTLIFQATHDFISKSQNDSIEPFSAILSSYIVFIERIADLLYQNFNEATLNALCDGINEFLSLSLTDWIYLDDSSRSDLEKSDKIIMDFVKKKPVEQHDFIISHLLSLSAPRQIFGDVIVRINLPDEHRRNSVQKAFSHVLTQFGLTSDLIKDPMDSLINYLQGSQMSDDPVEALLGEEGSKNVGLVQAIAVAIELSRLYLSEDSSRFFKNEMKLWENWLKCFIQHRILPKFSRQLISRVHLARAPSEAYLCAVGGLETSDSSLIEVIQSCKLLASSRHDNGINLPEGVKLDPIACRRFLSRCNVLKMSNFKPSMLEAILEVADNPHYDAFLRRILRGMQASGDAWVEMVLIGRALLSRSQRTGTMEEVLLNIERFLAD
ncbi:hypothetical protein Aperf_G00000081299 [Anoplocephala perfoliata]